MTRIPVKQYGIQRTGTNALKALLETNCQDVDVLSSTYGSKHGFPADDLPGDLRLVVSIKDPVTWVVSYYRFRSAKALDENPPRVYDPLETLVDQSLSYWASRTAAYLRLADERERVAIVQHETLLRDPLAVLASVKEALGLCWAPGERELFRDVCMRRGGEHDRGRALVHPRWKFSPDRHLNGDWAIGVSAEVVDRCWKFMDDFFMAYPRWRDYFDLDHLSETAARKEIA